MNAELVLDARATLAEGPFWDARNATLYWVDIPSGKVHLFDPSTGTDRSIQVNEMVGTVVPCVGGGLILAMQRGFGRLDVESETLAPVGEPVVNDPDLRFNDGKCDRAGRLWAGTISASRRPTAALYRLDADRTVHMMLDGLTNSNGIVWSLDNHTMYHIDTPTCRVDAFDFDLDRGTIANRRTVVQIEPGKPDGMAIDAEGMLWVAQFHAACVARWNPADGEKIAQIDLPVSNVTACAFGGADLNELYITTARGGLSEEQLEEQPHAGGVFVARPGVRGIEMPHCSVD